MTGGTRSEGSDKPISSRLFFSRLLSCYFLHSFRNVDWLRCHWYHRSDVDADGFKRVDGQTVLGHSDWWKIIPLVSVDIYQIGADFLVPISLMRPVPDQQFGPYEIVKNESWGVEMVYVTGIIRGKNGKIVRYITDNFGEVTKVQGIELAQAGKLDNVVVAKAKNGTAYLRSKPNMIIEDNIG